jgi:flavodoxin/ferredoxin
MNSIIIYHSQAGSTKQIAQAIAKGIKQSGQCDVIKLNDLVKPEELKRYDLIGFGSPVWHSRASANVRNFISGLAFLSGKPSFYFCTHGAMPGPVLSETTAIMRSVGLHVIGAADWYGSVFIPYMPKPYYTDGHPDDIDLKEAELFGSKMAERWIRFSSGTLTNLEPVKDKEYIVDAFLIPQLKKDLAAARLLPFKIVDEKCNRCMLCVKNCPSNNIDFTASPPVFKSLKCMRCWYCEQICPQGAIEYDWQAVVDVMEKFGRTGSIEVELDLAENKGYFRRLVPVSNVGLDNRWYKASKHPRLKVV